MKYIQKKRKQRRFGSLMLLINYETILIWRNMQNLGGRGVTSKKKMYIVNAISFFISAFNKFFPGELLIKRKSTGFKSQQLNWSIHAI